MTSIFAIDPALSCGWAIGTTSGRGVVIKGSGAWALASKEHPGARYYALERCLEALAAGHGGPNIVVYESGFVRGGPATRSHFGMVGIILAFACYHKAKPLSVTPLQLKAHAGCGTYDKAKMMKMAQMVFKRKVETSDEADALWLLDYAGRGVK